MSAQSLVSCVSGKPINSNFKKEKGVVGAVGLQAEHVAAGCLPVGMHHGLQIGLGKQLKHAELYGQSVP